MGEMKKNKKGENYLECSDVLWEDEITYTNEYSITLISKTKSKK